MDYLIVDMPPGTSDAALTVMQTLQLDGFVVVTRRRSLPYSTRGARST